MRAFIAEQTACAAETMIRRSALQTVVLLPVLLAAALGMLALQATRAVASSAALTNEEIVERLNLTAPYPPQCPYGWGSAYAEKHEKMLTRVDSKRLVAVPNLSGLADRVIGVATLALVSMLTDRAFQVGHRDPLIPLQSVFAHPHINWVREPDPAWTLEPLKHDAKERNYNSTVLERKDAFALNTIDDWKLQDKFLRQKLQGILPEEFTTVFAAMNRGKTIRIFENTNHNEQLKALGLTPATAFGCVVHYLFTPKPEVFARVGDLVRRVTEARKAQTLLIGIQIRAGDAFLTRPDHAIDVGGYGAFFDCARQIEEWAVVHGGYKDTKWLLVSDSLPLRHQAVKRYGADKIITSLHATIEHSAKETSVCREGHCDVSTEGFREAAAEWWLFSYAHYHVISQYSGFGRSAGMLSFEKNSIYTVPYKQNSKTITCSSASFTELGDLPYEWSGI